MGGVRCVVFCGEERNLVYSDCGASGEATVKFYKSNQNLHIFVYVLKTILLQEENIFVLIYENFRRFLLIYLEKHIR